MKLKTIKSGNLKHGKTEKQAAQVVSYQYQPRSLKQRSLGLGAPGFLSSFVAGDVLIGIFEVDAL